MELKFTKHKNFNALKPLFHFVDKIFSLDTIERLLNYFDLKLIIFSNISLYQFSINLNSTYHLLLKRRINLMILGLKMPQLLIETT